MSTKKDILDALKRANKVINCYSDKLKELDKDVIIFTSIVFTSDKDFYYLFSIYRDNKLIEKIRANDVKEFDKTFTELTNKYEVNILYNYADLNSNQINYLQKIKPPRVNDADIESISFNMMFDIFK